MKLLSKYNRVTLLSTIVIMLFTGIIYYVAIKLILIEDIDKDLAVEENEIFEYVKVNHALPQVFESEYQQIIFQEAKPGSVKREFVDTLYRNIPYSHHGRHHRHEEFESGRGLISVVTAGNKTYRVLIVKSTVETEDLLKIIFGITAGVILLLLLVLLISNRLLLNRLWQPFHNLLKELRSFKLSDAGAIALSETNIDEFKELNQAVVAMASRVKSDYTDLKTFTENASHELLTPIAVINSKLDTLLQTENFSQQQSKLLNDLYSAVSRLTRLNQSLILLVKIENRLVEGHQPVNLKAEIEDFAMQFEEIFNDKQIALKTDLSDKHLETNLYLVEILLNNLFSNAIRHNFQGGIVNIILRENELVIENSGDADALQPEKVFKRFNKSTNSEGSGLGLTISKQICENLGFDLSYFFNSGLHTFRVSF